MSTVEREPGVWTLVDSTGREYGRVRIVREGGALVYVSELRGQMLGGRNMRLRDAVEKLHAAFVLSYTDTRVRPDHHQEGTPAAAGVRPSWNEQKDTTPQIHGVAPSSPKARRGQ